MAGNKLPMFVVDCSFVLSHFMADETREQSDIFFDQFEKGKISFLSTPLLPLEVLNGIKMAIIRKRVIVNLAESVANDFLAVLPDIEIESVNAKMAWRLALEENLTVYDASYLALAREKKCSLLSLDKDLQKFAYKFD